MMICKTCHHTMHRAHVDDQLFWCPRCGTIVGPNNEFIEPEIVTCACVLTAVCDFAQAGSALDLAVKSLLECCRTTDKR